MRQSSFVRWTILFAVISLLFATGVAAQQQGGGAAAPGGNVGTGTPGGTTQPGQSPFPGQQNRTQPQTTDPTQQSQFPEMQRPIFLSGKVILEDGTPPPEPVVIERVCNGQIWPEGYTDSKGRFSFQLGQNMQMMPDASVSSASDSTFGQQGSRGPGIGPGGRNFTERDLMGCELRATLPGYRSEMVNLAGRRMMDNPDVGTMILRRLGNVEGKTTSATSLNAPKDAKKAYQKAQNLAKKKKWPEAQVELEKAVEIYPKYASAWFDLGQVHLQQDRVEDARKAYAQALEADAKYINPYLQLAALFAKESKWRDVADTTDRAIKLNPFDFPQAYFYNAVANYNLQNMDAAEKSARDGLKADDLHRIPKLQHLLGVILAQKQDYNGAAEQMRDFLKRSPTSPDADMVRKQLTELEKFTGKTDAAQNSQK